MSALAQLVNQDVTQRNQFIGVSLNLNLTMNNLYGLKTKKFRGANFTDISDAGLQRKEFSVEKHLLLKTGIYFNQFENQEEKQTFCDVLEIESDLSECIGFVIAADFEDEEITSNAFSVEQIRYLQNFVRPPQEPKKKEIVAHKLWAEKLAEVADSVEAVSSNLAAQLFQLFKEDESFRSFCSSVKLTKREKKDADEVLSHTEFISADFNTLSVIQSFAASAKIDVQDDIDTLKFFQSNRSREDFTRTFNFSSKTSIGQTLIKQIKTLLGLQNARIPDYLDNHFSNCEDTTPFVCEVYLIFGESKLQAPDMSDGELFKSYAGENIPKLDDRRNQSFYDSMRRNKEEKIKARNFLPDFGFQKSRLELYREHKNNTEFGPKRQSLSNEIYGLRQKARNLDQEGDEYLKLRETLQKLETEYQQFIAETEKIIRNFTEKDIPDDFRAEKAKIQYKSDARGREKEKVKAYELAGSRESSPVARFDEIELVEMDVHGAAFTLADYGISIRKKLLNVMGHFMDAGFRFQKLDLNKERHHFFSQFIVWLVAKRQVQNTSETRSLIFADMRAFIFSKGLYFDSKEVAYLKSSSSMKCEEGEFYRFCEFYSDSNESLIGLTISAISFLKSNHHVSAQNLGNTTQKIFKALGYERDVQWILDLLECGTYFGSHVASMRLIIAFLKWCNIKNPISKSIMYRLNPDPPNSSAYCNLERFMDALEGAFFFEIIGNKMNFSYKHFKNCMELIHANKHFCAPYSLYLYGHAEEQNQKAVDQLEKYFPLAIAVFSSMPMSSLALSAALKKKAALASGQTIIANLLVDGFISGFRSFAKLFVLNFIKEKVGSSNNQLLIEN